MLITILLLVLTGWAYGSYSFPESSTGFQICAGLVAIGISALILSVISS